MIRLLHVITSLEVGGAQRMLVKLCERIDRERFATRVVSLLDGGRLRPELEALGVEVHSLGMRAGAPDPRAMRRLRGMLRREPADVVQSWLYHADLVATAALRGLRPAPVLAWNLRCTAAPAGSGRSLAARFAPRLCAWSSKRPAVIVTNSSAGRISHEAIGYRPRAWRLIPNGFDLERYRPDPQAGAALRAELGLEPGHVLIGMLARWHPMKQHPMILDAAARLAESVPRARFVLAGTDVHLDAPDFAAAHARAGSPANVIALGERHDVPRLAAGFDLLVSASDVLEGFPNALGEALASGTPCVTTDVGDSAAVVGDAGLVVPPGDGPSLVRALSELCSRTAEERRALGARGRERMREAYELGAVVRQYEELYQELVEAASCAA